MTTLAQELRHVAAPLQHEAAAKASQDQRLDDTIEALISATGKMLAQLALAPALAYLREQISQGQTEIWVSAVGLYAHTPVKEYPREYRPAQRGLSNLIDHATAGVEQAVKAVINELPDDSKTYQNWHFDVYRSHVMAAFDQELANLLQAPEYGFQEVVPGRVTL